MPATISAHGPVKAFAENQPVTSIVNLRALLEQQPVGHDIWIALAAGALGILAVAYAFAMRAYHRRIA